MLRRAFLTVFVVVLLPATVHAFDHHHHHHSGSSDGGGCSSSSSSDGSSSGSGSAEMPPSPTSTSTSTEKHVFITSTTFSGALGGLGAADAYCQAAADARGLSGVFRAWLSDAHTNAYDRIYDAGPWYTTGGSVAFGSKTELRGAARAELLDESGAYPTSLAGAWSGSDAEGISSGQDCEGWTNATVAASATTGSGFSSDTAWGGGNTPLPCNSKAPLLCFQQ